MERLRQRFGDRKLELNISKEATDWLTNAGYDHVYRARPLKRAIQRVLETPMARVILAGHYSEGMTTHVRIKEGRLKLN